MRPFPLTVLSGGINRLRVKGGASSSMLYDLQNAYITNAGSIQPREGTNRTATLDSSTVGLAAANGQFNIFSSQYSSAALPTGFVLNVTQNPSSPTSPPYQILFAKPFMGFLYVVVQFADGNIFHYWLQNDGTWTSSTVYTSASIVLPPVANGLAYQGVRDFPSQPLWSPDTIITSASYVEPNTPTGFAYQAIAVTGSPVHTGAVEPVWPTTAGGILQEFGDFDASSTDAGTTQGNSPFSTASGLGSTITDRYGDSATIANSGIFATASTLSTLTLASTKVQTWTAGTSKAPGSVVIPTSNQGGFVNAIPDGDFSAGTGWNFTDVGGTLNWAFGTGRPYVGTADIEFPSGGGIGADGAYATMATLATCSPGQAITINAYVDPNNSGSNLEIWVQINWYNASSTMIGFTRSGGAEGGGYRQLSVTGTAPAGTAYAACAFRAGSGTSSRNVGYVGLVSWTLETPAPITNFLFEAVQPSSGVTGATQPTWPTVLGNTVVDGTVTWEAIGTSIITWQAIPLMYSGLTTPSFPTTIGNSVHDFSTYSNLNGYITSTSMSWEAISRQVSELTISTAEQQPAAVALGASHVFAGDNDIVDYSAAVNPIDWTSTNNAGYLPTGLNNYGDNPVAVLALYRSNLMVFNAGGYQMWQIDPDPQNMALLDAQAIGSVWPRAAQSVANDLLFLTEVGVRNLGTLGATANMAIGNTGQPVDPLIVAAMSTASALANPLNIFSTYYPGRGQYWLIVGTQTSQAAQAYVLTINGTGTKSWARYIFPQALSDATLNSGSLFLRTTGNLVWQLTPTAIGVDDYQATSASAIPFNGVVQWPYLDVGVLGINKMLVGVDLVGEGNCSIQVAFNQQDKSTFNDNANFATSTGVTSPYFVAVDDTVPGEPLPIPINAPSYSLILTFTGSTSSPNAWSWEAANLYLVDASGGGATG